MDPVCKDSSSLWISQGTSGILWPVFGQETVVEKGVVSPDTQLVEVLEMKLPYVVEIFALK